MFIIRSETDKLRAIDHIRSMALSPVQFVDIDDYKRNRTNSQNRYFHKCCKIISDYTGDAMETIKDKIVLSIWPPETKEVTVFKNGERHKYTLAQRRSTTKLDTKEFTDLLNAVFMIAHKLELQLPIPDDIKEIMR